MNCISTIERCKLHLCQNHGNGNGEEEKSGANKFEITIPRERLLTDEEMKEERREQKIRRTRR